MRTDRKITFGDCEINLDEHQLERNGVPRHIEPKALDLLTYLALNRDRVVPHEELQGELWPGIAGARASLAQCVFVARQAVGDSGSHQRVIRTYNRRGHRFVARVESAARTSSGVYPVADDPRSRTG